ncbi:hypothetical protein DMA11_22235 [Marinilabiliaceae bacterium JC017]|nr:hypothetical protein DMA11_22235 [Marinilabiliaceae bacterium JC017]
MKHGDINLVDLDFEYKLWKKRLEQFQKEVKILKYRNEEVKHEVKFTELNTVELMVLDQHNDELEKVISRIKTQERELQYYNKDFPITKSHQYFKEHEELRKKMTGISTKHLAWVDDLIKAFGI